MDEKTQERIGNGISEGTLSPLTKDMLAVADATTSEATRYATSCLHIRADGKRLEATDGRQMIQRELEQSCSLVPLPEKGILLEQSDIRDMKRGMKKNERWIISNYHRNGGPGIATMHKIAFTSDDVAIINTSKDVTCHDGTFPPTDEVIGDDWKTKMTIDLDPVLLSNALHTLARQSDRYDNRVTLHLYEEESPILITGPNGRAVVMPCWKKAGE